MRKSPHVSLTTFSNRGTQHPASFLRLDMFIDDELPEDEIHAESMWQDVVGGAVDPEVACLREVELLAPNSDHGDRAILGCQLFHVLRR